ncbi:MAG: VWA domain-containing protein [Desulfosarcinaceae bacterium]|nr:VWA domain-containing protein [Desulfosarcinaceae bacterium]
MKFAQAPMLYLIWLVPLAAGLFWYGQQRRQRVLKRFAKPPGLAVILPKALPRRGTRAILALLVLTLVAIAMAGPQYGYRWREVERRGVDLVIALDCSRSMLAQDIAPTRLDRAKREIIDLLGMLEGDRVGLVAFAGTAFLQCPLTVDYAAFHLFLNHLGPDFLPVGGTDLAAALTVATESFDPEVASDKAVILITDGGHTAPGDLQAALASATASKIKLFCIGVGGEGGVPIPAAGGGFKKDRSGKIVLSRLDETGLKQMALATGGGYVRSVAGDMDLDAVYRQQIRKEMTSRTLTTRRRQVWEDRYQWILGLALALLVTEMLLPARRRPQTGGVLVIVLAAGALWLPPQSWAADAKEAIEKYATGDYATALKGFIDQQLRDPDNPEVLYNVGNAYYKTGDFAAAGQHYADALDQLTDTAAADLAARLHYNLGNAQYRGGQYAQAIASYERALALNPDDIQAKENLEYVKRVMAQPPPPNQDQAGQGQNAQPPQEQDAQQRSERDPASGEQKADAAAGPDRSSQDAQGEQDQPSSGGTNQDAPQRTAGSKFGEQMDNADERQADAAEPPSRGAEDPSGPAPSQPAAPEIDPRLAEQMLNRLEDQPGRAMIPAYQGRKVEKDW